MLASGRRALHLKKPSRPQLWICRRCFHAQTQGIAQQQADQVPDTTGTSGVQRPLSPIEIFLNRYGNRNKQSQRQNPSHEIVEERVAVNTRTPPLSEIAKAYRKKASGTSAKHDRELDPSKQLYKELIRLDEMWDAGDNEIFNGEYMREDYQGAVALNGQEYIKKKYPFKQGDVVETRSYGALLSPGRLIHRESGPSLGLVVTDRYLESHRLCYAINLRGKLFSFMGSSVQLVLPNVVPLEKVRRLDELLETAAEPPKRPDRAPPAPVEHAEEYRTLLGELTGTFRELKMEADNALRSIRKGRDSVYSLLRHENPNLMNSAFTPDVAMQLFETDEPTYAELLAAHQTMSTDGTHFIADPTRHLETATFVVRAYRDILIVRQVADWIRDSSTEYQSFIDKACKLITISRSLPKTTSPAKLDIRIDSDLYFDNNDRHIIEFIADYASGPRGFIPDEVLALAPYIIKSTGLYPPEITPNPNRDAAKLFLTEIGVWQPSEHLPRKQDAGIITDRIYKDQTAGDVTEDTNADIRHDFGDMPVYTIDDASAHELDDGISIEETEEGAQWLHIHIANPSAFLHPESDISTLARLRQTTLYLPDRMSPMLPIGDPKFKAKGFSKDAKVMPTMTFSARLGTDGNIAEYKVRAGLVRNIKILTYDGVDNTLFPGDAPPVAAWWTGSYVKPDYIKEGKQFDTITPEIQSQLEMIENMIQSHREWRRAQGALRIEFLGSSIQVNPGPLTWEPPSLHDPTNNPSLRKTVPTFVRGNAGIKFSINNQQTRSRCLIEELMIIANRVAGLYSQDNNLPVPYRGLTLNMPEPLLEQARSTQPSGTQPLPFALSRELIATSGSWSLQQSTVPQAHELLGIPAKHGGYVQVTSPMRRYLDILAHWQIEAHLHSRPLPFPTDVLTGTGETSFLQASRRIFRRISIARVYNRHYASQAVAQLIRDPRSIGSTHLWFVGGKPLLTGFTLEREIAGRGYMVMRSIMVKELGVVGLLRLRADDTVPEFGTEFPVEIYAVEETDGRIIFRVRRD